jgi:hypothetical protein
LSAARLVGDVPDLSVLTDLTVLTLDRNEGACTSHCFFFKIDDSFVAGEGAGVLAIQ